MEKEIIWKGSPTGIITGFLNNIGISSTIYEIVDDELIIKEGFFKRNTKVIKLSNLKEPTLVEGLYQRFIKVGTIYLKTIDDNKIVILKNLKEPESVRQIFTNILKNNSDINN